MMIFDTAPINPIDIPSDPRDRATWIVVQLRKRGYSLRMLSMTHGFSHTYTAGALVRPLYPAEVIIATALGTTPEVLFAERYDRKGKRLHSIRDKDSAKRRKGNVENEEVIQP